MRVGMILKACNICVCEHIHIVLYLASHLCSEFYSSSPPESHLNWSTHLALITPVFQLKIKDLYPNSWMGVETNLLARRDLWGAGRSEADWFSNIQMAL